jgi:hypothetical protein
LAEQINSVSESSAEQINLASESSQDTSGDSDGDPETSLPILTYPEVAQRHLYLYYLRHDIEVRSEDIDNSLNELGIHIPLFTLQLHPKILFTIRSIIDSMVCQSPDDTTTYFNNVLLNSLPSQTYIYRFLSHSAFSEEQVQQLLKQAKSENIPDIFDKIYTLTHLQNKFLEDSLQINPSLIVHHITNILAPASEAPDTTNSLQLTIEALSRYDPKDRINYLTDLYHWAVDLLEEDTDLMDPQQIEEILHSPDKTLKAFHVLYLIKAIGVEIAANAEQIGHDRVIYIRDHPSTDAALQHAIRIADCEKDLNSDILSRPHSLLGPNSYPLIIFDTYSTPNLKSQ